ncbi:MAG: FHA domain-containing protein [Oligoflexia bacterium]|nr:FHA domain-containing protein [Oligoflexia bacterium]
MAKLRIFQQGVPVTEKDLDTSQTYVIGRGSQCDIVLDHPEVSRQHTKIRHDGQNWIAEVLSRFGRIIVHGTPVESVSLSHGAVFYIPPFEIRMEETATSGLSQTIPIQATNQSAAEFSDKTKVAEVSLKSALFRLDATGEPVEEITLGAGVIEAGRSRSCPIQLKEEAASRKHFTILFDGSQFILQDQNGSLPTLVNGSPISTHVLQTGDEISVGLDRFRFELVNPEFENLPAVIEDVSEKTEPHVLKMTPEQVPAIYQHAPPVSYEESPYGRQKPHSKKNTFRIAILALAVVAGIGYVFKGQEPQQTQTRVPAGQGAVAVATYEKLSEQDKKLIEDTYNLAQSLYTSGKYELAAIELEKLLKIYPKHKKALELQSFSQQALERKRELDDIERRDKEQAELQSRINATLDSCERLYRGGRHGEVEGCVSQISDLDPENERAQELNAMAQQAMEQIALTNEQRAAASRRRQQAKSAFEVGKKAFNEKRYPAAISQFQKVIQTPFADSEGMKAKSKLGIQAAKERMQEQSGQLVREGKGHLDNKDYKNAISKFKKALTMFPNNGDASILLEKAQKDSNVELKNLYAESVLEENLGNIDSAKRKWKTILDSGLVDSEYYRKAKSKLGKYER